LEVSRSSYYYESKGESAENLMLMKIMDKLYTKCPFLGYPQMTVQLRKNGYNVNEKRVYRLMKLMNIQSVLPKPNTSKASVEHEKYPYLLKGRNVLRPQEIWATDITYIPMERGFMYLIAVMDWYSRFVLSWKLSNIMDVNFCIEALEASFKWGFPAIFNTDQGSQFTSLAFTERLKRESIRISMNGKGRAIDNVFVERLWRTVKYESVYLYSFDNGLELYKELSRYFEYYNYQRGHSSLGNKTPSEVYFDYMI
jgi:putative transposase